MKEEQLVRKIKDFIQENLEEELSLDEIGRKLNYSKYHINRVFAENTVITIYQYIKNRRLEEAARKLADSDKAIIEIAYESGYHSQQAFTNAFHKVYECPPKVYRSRSSIKPILFQGVYTYQWKSCSMVVTGRRMAA